MSINYSDGRAIETEITELVGATRDLSSLAWIARERYADSWPIHYHLSPERSALLRHLDFTGLDVLELGCGMGAVSRGIAERARSLTLVEGTEARLATARARLRDLSNWRALSGNFFDLELTEKFDVVTLIGVLEYSELFGPAEKPFEVLLKKARAWLKPDGCLIIAIENRLGLKYWSGSAEDHTNRLFDGILDYPAKPSARTFSRQELSAILAGVGFGHIVRQYPFPDYKLPASVVSEDLCLRFPRVAGEIAAGRPFVNYNLPQTRLFPNYLATTSLARAGLLPEFANSFLFLASESADSPTLRRLSADPAVQGWHYGLGRRSPIVTEFALTKGAPPVARKRRLMDGNVAHAGVQHREVSSEIVEGEALREALARAAYFEDWAAYLGHLRAFLSWSCEKWAIGPRSEGQLAGECLDAIFANAIQVAQPERYRLFDLEWNADAPVAASWFVLRNVLMLDRDQELFTSQMPFHCLRDLYMLLCAELGLTAQPEVDLRAEFNLQAEAVVIDDPVGYYQTLEKVFTRPFTAARPFLTHPGRLPGLYDAEQHLTQRVETMHAQLGEVTRQLRETREELGRRDIVLSSPHHRLAEWVNARIPRVRLLRRAIKRVFGWR